MTSALRGEMIAICWMEGRQAAYISVFLVMAEFLNKEEEKQGWKRRTK
jgi:hypothetical protein